MSEPEHFIARWSRRKRDAANDSERTAEGTERTPQDAAKTASRGTEFTERPDATQPSAGEAQTATSPADQIIQPPAFDLSQLPPLESITAATDIRAFLQPGVPADLARAALRRAWAADPQVRDFVGLADYDWDFNQVGAIPGFAPLEMTDELRRMAADMVGRSLNPDEARAKPTTAASKEGSPPPIESSGDLASDVPALPNPMPAAAQDEEGQSDVETNRCDELTRPDQEIIAVQQSETKVEYTQPIIDRPRGRALPK